MEYPKGKTTKLPGAKMTMKQPGSGEIKSVRSRGNTEPYASRNEAASKRKS